MSAILWKFKPCKMCVFGSVFGIWASAFARLNVTFLTQYNMPSDAIKLIRNIQLNVLSVAKNDCFRWFSLKFSQYLLKLSSTEHNNGLNRFNENITFNVKTLRLRSVVYTPCQMDGFNAEKDCCKFNQSCYSGKKIHCMFMLRNIQSSSALYVLFEVNCNIYYTLLCENCWI